MGDFYNRPAGQANPTSFTSFLRYAKAMKVLSIRHVFQLDVPRDRFQVGGMDVN